MGFLARNTSCQSLDRSQDFNKEGRCETEPPEEDTHRVLSQKIAVQAKDSKIRVLCSHGLRPWSETPSEHRKP